MKTSENAPCTCGSTASAFASMLAGPLPAAAGPAAVPEANSEVRTSVSEVAVPAPRGLPAMAASSSVLIRLPLWPSARLTDGVARKVGCAFSQTDDPVVEYRQCPTAMCPRSVLSTDSLKTWATRPMSLKTTILLPSLTAIPADSWPRCCSAYRPKYASFATSSSCVQTPNTPQASLGGRSAELRSWVSRPSGLITTQV